MVPSKRDALKVFDVMNTPDSQFELMTARALQKLAEGVISNYTRMKKDELINSLKTFKAKQKKALEIKEQSNPLYTIGIHIFRTIQKFSTEDKDTRQRLVARFASQLIARETAEYPNIKTRRSRKIDYINTAFQERANLAPENSNLQDDLILFKELIDTAWSEEITAFTQEYKTKVRDLDADENTEIIDPRELIKEAHEVLNSTNTNDWRAIVKALCFVTGRRPSEILVTAHFEYLSDYAAIFTGQLKAKREIKTMVVPDRINEKIVIPTLATIEQINNGLKLLKDKRLDPGDNYIKVCEQADKSYSSALSKYMKGSGYTLKDMRKVYAVTTYELFGRKANKLKWFARVLGHATLDASQSYVKYFIPEEIKSEIDINDDKVYQLVNRGVL